MTTHLFHQLDVMRKATERGRTITDCYRLLYKKDFWATVIKQLTSKYQLQDAMHDLSMHRDQIRDELRAGKFRFSKTNQWNIKDELMIEAVVMIMEKVLNISNLVHEGNQLHSSLQQIRTWKKVNWCIKVNLYNATLKKISQQRIIAFIAERIKDHRFIHLIYHTLIASLQSKRREHTSSSVTMIEIWEQIYWHIFEQDIARCKYMLWNDYRLEFTYALYNDICMFGITGSKKQTNFICDQLTIFLQANHPINGNVFQIDKPILFHGYQISRERMKETAFYQKEFQRITLKIPKQRMNQWVSQKGYGNLETNTAKCRKRLLHYTPQRILSVYNAELISFAYYYHLADNFNDLEKLVHLAESSFLKTIAYKHKTTSKQIASSMKRNVHGSLSLVCKDIKGNTIYPSFIKMHQLKMYRKNLLKYRKSFLP